MSSARFFSMAVRSTTISLLHVATNLDEGRSVIGCFDRTDIDLVHRGGEQIGRFLADIAITGEADNGQLILLLHVGGVAQLDTRCIGEGRVHDSHIFLVDRTDLGPHLIVETAGAVGGEAAAEATVSGPRLRYRAKQLPRRIEQIDPRVAHVEHDEKRVIVPRYKGKNQLRYRVTLSENALAWLKPHVKETGSILVRATATNRFSKQMGSPSYVATRSRILKAAQKAAVKLPDNAGRHTFISMHVAHYESIDKTALEADNSAAIIKKDYLDIVTREDADKFWAILPE